MADLKQLWESSLVEIEPGISKANFATWFKNTYILKEESGVVYVSAPSSFVKEWLANKYHKVILRSLRSLSENIRNVEYVVAPKGGRKEPVEDFGENKKVFSNELPLKDLYNINKEDNLNPKYSFESFVVGPFNETSYAAAQAIIKELGAYNPLFIYGGTGLGKTHLIQAIGNEIKKTDFAKKVYYVTSEKFLLDFINSVQANKISLFKEKYRKFDVLIMDDVQYLAGKSGTQDELHHLINTALEGNKQIIFSSDKHYNYIPELEDRLRSRFGAGMMVDIGEPDFESRIAILRSKVRNRNFSPSDEVLNFIAKSVTGSIRELEGILNSIVHQSQLKNKELSVAEISTLIKNNEKVKKAVTAEDVIKIVSSFYNIDKEVICEKTRKKEVVKPRQLIMYLLREDFSVSYPSIGQKLGGRDHTTVIHSCEKVKNDLKKDSVLVQELEQIRAML